MKLIIDIPENEYRHIKEYYEKNDIVEATYSYIYHGTPLDDVLDKIRAEIKRLPYQRIFGNVSSYSLLDVVIEIIDEYREEQE